MSIDFRQIKDLCTLNIVRKNPASEPDNDFWYIDISSVDNATKTICSPSLVKGKTASVRARQIVQENDVLVSTTRPNLNAVALVPPNYHGQICSTGFCVLRCGAEIDPEYLFNFVRSRSFVEALGNLVQGALYPAVTDKQVMSQLIPWMPIKKQRQIAARLKVQLAEVEKARLAAVAQLTDARLLSSRHRENSMKQLASVKRVPLGDLLLGIEAGKSFQTTELLARPDELGVLKVSAVSWNEFRPQEAKGIEGEYHPDERHRIKNGDLIISRANTLELVGAAVRVEGDYPFRLLSDKTLRLVVDEEQVLPNYLLTLLKWPEARAHIENNATGTSDSMRNISQKTIFSIPIPLLSLDEQRKIVNQTEAVNKELLRVQVSVKKVLADLALLPQKILTQAFSTFSSSETL